MYKFILSMQDTYVKEIENLKNKSAKKISKIEPDRESVGLIKKKRIRKKYLSPKF